MSPRVFWHQVVTLPVFMVSHGEGHGGTTHTSTLASNIGCDNVADLLSFYCLWYVLFFVGGCSHLICLECVSEASCLVYAEGLPTL